MEYKTKRKIQKKRLMDALFRLFFVLLVFTILTQGIFGIHMVRETSMSPNLSGLVLSNRLSYKARDPMRGDVIIFRRKGRLLVKRVIGLPGESLRIWGGRVWIKGKLLEEDYLADSVITDGDQSYKVPDGMYFVLGDQRDVSLDSRAFPECFIDREKIQGRVFYSLSSFSQFPGKIISQTKGG